MIWGWPGAFWFLGLLAPLAALFLYRRRAVLTIVPSIILWDPYLRLVAGNPLGRHLRRLLALAVQCLILTAMVLGLADPRPPQRESEDLAIVVDCSTTMQTREPGGLTRFGNAVAQARAAVDGAPGNTAITIIKAGVFPEVVLRSEADKARARAALLTLATADVDTDLGEAIRFAQTLRTGARPLRVICVSDFCGTNPSDDLLSGKRHETSALQLVQVGSNLPNIGIVDLRAAPDGQSLLMTVAQHGFLGAEATLHLRIGDREAATGSVRMETESAEVSLPARMKEGDAFSVVLAPSDGLSVDNTAFGIWPERDEIKVRLVSEGNPFLEQALRAQPGAAVERVRPEDWVHSPDASVTVLDSPLGSGLQQLPGRFIVFSPQTTEDERLSGMAEENVISSWQADHPILRAAQPDSWGAIRGSIAPAWKGARTLAAAQDRPVAFEWPESSQGLSQPATRVVVFNFDLQSADLPLKPAFPVLVWDTIDYLTGRERVEDVARPTGTAIRVPAAGPPCRITTPGRVTSDMLTSGDGYVISQDTQHQGLYEIQEGQNTRRVAMNWMSTRSASPWRPISKANPLQTAGSRIRLSGVSWRELLIAAGILAAVEWVLFHSRLLRMD